MQKKLLNVTLLHDWSEFILMSARSNDRILISHVHDTKTEFSVRHWIIIRFPWSSTIAVTNLKNFVHLFFVLCSDVFFFIITRVILSIFLQSQYFLHIYRRNNLNLKDRLQHENDHLQTIRIQIVETFLIRFLKSIGDKDTIFHPWSSRINFLHRCSLTMSLYFDSPLNTKTSIS